MAQYPCVLYWTFRVSMPPENEKESSCVFPLFHVPHTAQQPHLPFSVFPLPCPSNASISSHLVSKSPRGWSMMKGKAVVHWILLYYACACTILCFIHAYSLYIVKLLLQLSYSLFSLNFNRVSNDHSQSCDPTSLYVQILFLQYSPWLTNCLGNSISWF